MTNNLSEFQNDNIFIDANVFIYFFRLHPEYSKTCQQFFSNLQNKKFKGFTTAFVIEEVVYILLIRSIADDFDKHPTKIIRDNPEVVRKYTNKLHKAITIIFSMGNLSILETPVELFFSMVENMEYGLLTRDALYLAVMDQNNIKNIASFDSDFDRVDKNMRWGV
ncbi:MAG: type II toxin-antitoxin system VapC family toxin [ANME-2 cluster archaeon]|nr:type II toxin-antitoxin system VapC family toxin [ANME-2 cluster archaeon]